LKQVKDDYGNHHSQVEVPVAALLPGGAGQNFLADSTDPLSPTLSVVVLLAWVAAALVLGTRILTRRDA